MCANWINKNHLPHNVINRLDQMRSVQGDGSVSFSSGLEFYDYRTVLFSSIHLSDAIPDSEKTEIISTSIMEAAKKGILTAKSIMNEVSRKEKSFVNHTLSDYVLITNISIKYFISLRRISVNGCHVIFSRSLPKKLNDAREKFLQYGKHHIFGNMPSFYTSIRINVKGRSPLEAGERALGAINLLRAVWNLFYNQTIGTGTSSGRKDPINRIMLGPLHSLHSMNGKYERFWYDTKYVKPLSPTDISSDFLQLRIFERKIRKKIPSSHKTMSEKIIRGLLWYVSALDEWDNEAAFLRLWSLLEYLTGTTGDRYDVTINRMASICNDRDFHKEILEHLRVSRNGNIHLNQSPEYTETLVFQTKRYVEAILKHLLSGSSYYRNYDEAKQYFDQPSDEYSLRTRIKLAKLKLRSSK